VTGTVKAYLLMVTFFGNALFGQGGMNDWKALSGSPYDGVVVRINGAYDPAPYDLDAVTRGLNEVAVQSGKDAWPFVFINRMTGLAPGSELKGDETEEAANVYRGIKGLDVFDRSGARSAFLHDWRVAVTAAREAGSPGVVLDLELYNDREMYDVGALAGTLSVGLDECITGLKSLGSDMADVCGEEYPECVVWTMFSGIADEYRDTGLPRSVGYVALGFLERCSARGYGVVLVAGGEHTLRYCQCSPERLAARIDARKKLYGDMLAKYGKNLALGGCIAPWDKASDREGWMRRGDCGSTNVDGVDGFVPFFRVLGENYEYVWIYAAMSAPYNPFDLSTSERYNKALGEVFGPKGEGVPVTGPEVPAE